MNATTTVTVGSGKSIHWGSDCGTICGAAHRNGMFTEPKLVKAATATCKRCIKIMATKVEADHAEALLVEEIETARTDAKNEDAQRTWDAERAEDLAPASKSFPAAVALDTWLKAGLVLVGPSTDTLYVFENWTGGTAVLASLTTGAMEYVAQADIVNWRYLPGAELEEVPAEQVKAEDVVLFHAGVRFRVVEEVEHHRGTDLFSFSVLGNVVQFVRHAPEAVKRLVIPRG